MRKVSFITLTLLFIKKAFFKSLIATLIIYSCLTSLEIVLSVSMIEDKKHLPKYES